MPFRYTDLRERIIANSMPAEDSAWNGSRCWLWLGATHTGNRGMRYPTMTMRYKSGPRKGKVHTVRVHRKVVEVFLGRRVTPKMVVMHLCNNSLCVNPEHLRGGTQKANVRQCVKDGRHYSPLRKAAP